MVIAYHMVQKGIEKGYAEGYPEGYAQGLAKGRAEAYKDANKQTAAYFKRMLEAREKGEDFNEPPPTFGRNGR